MSLINCKNHRPQMKDSRNEMNTQKQISKEPGKSVNEKDSVYLRLALAIEELTSDDFVFDDEMDEP